MRFDEMNLSEQLMEALSYMGFEEASPIQEKTMPAILDNKDVMACAQTGTGKTAAFVLPVLNKLTEEAAVEGVNTLIIVPTRELALQIELQIQGFSYFLNAGSIAIYGGGNGDDWEQQKKALSKGTDIVVATPGKLLSHLNMGYVKMQQLKHLVLDEADRMLDMGFYDDIKRIISYLPKERQTLMFSATMPPKIKELANTILKDPLEVSLALSKPAEGVLQAVYPVYDNQKTPLISHLIADKPEYESIIVFSSTKRKVQDIVRSLKNKGYAVEAISSDLEQAEREKVLQRFRARQVRVLVATDVLSRGIDIKDINLVINYDVPGNAEDYVHRVGRTARASTTGVAITLVNPDDMYKFDQIEKLIEREIFKIPVPSDMGESPEWNAKALPKRNSYRQKSGKNFRKPGGKPRS